MAPVERYFRVRFSDERALGEWAAAIMRLAMAPLGLAAAARLGPRPVILVPMFPIRREPAFGFVSEDARPLADRFAPGVELDGAVLRLRELPDGLTVLHGEGADADAYEGRGFSRRRRA